MRSWRIEPLARLKLLVLILALSIGLVLLFGSFYASFSKGVAQRVPYQDYKSPSVKTICDIECRDEGMLVPFLDYTDSHPTGDIYIVLHQMGNHGPAYYKRYPAPFKHSKPTCQSNDLSQCTREEIVNAYDKALLYTDDFLAKGQ